ncbi:hypothetical protein TVAG_325000 [Trichomonas vaginalis G3]|uniref:Uncharacterized protein n=1 Tax=Trichomonas vaginalis (strain ATCC PRA-98 / G3) TaxID=412133 RepID=A2F135_TRIV3|nr:biological adhesion protein [Trichomonas vaginalis G3]EAY01386.1 hypothetical protein TVAG_325000 [Trichomonas vaginalis G3]KAI5497464.1 biological adhesion protein [Trichomonas vaginalis G3]|eukprot:XP_001330234.1 hypothetical protein [Trichomonas vaginalis G3]
MSCSDDDSCFDYEECEDEALSQESFDCLRQENELLKAKFEKAIEISQKVKELQEQNTELQAQIKDGQREKEEIEHRLELANRTIKENEAQLAKQKRIGAEQVEEVTKQFNAKIAAMKKQSDDEINYLTEQLNQLLTDAENNEVKEKTEKARLGRLFRSVKRYFNEEIASIEDLMNQLNKEPQKQETTATVPPPQETKPVKEVDEAKLNKYKQALKDANSQISTLNQQLAEAQKVLKEQKRTSEMKINNLTSEIQDHQQKLKDTKEKSQAKIQNLEGRLANMKTEVSKARAVPPEIIDSGRNFSVSPINSQQNIVISPPAEPRKVSFKEPSTQKEQIIQSVDMLKDKNAQLTEELTSALESNRKKEQQINQLNSELSQIRVNHKNNEVELISLREVHAETVHELETLRETLHARQTAIEETQHQLDEKKDEDEKTRKRFECAKKKLNGYKSQNQKLQDDKEALEERVDEQRRQLNTVTDAKNQLEKKLKDTTQELAETQHKLKGMKVLTAEDLLPPHIWAMKGADDQLAGQINRIACNPALQVPSKLQAVYQAIADNYAQQVEVEEGKVNDLVEQMEKNRTIMNQFIVDASIILNGEAITYDDLIKNETTKKEFLNKLGQLREDVDQIKYENEKLTSFTKLYQECFGSSTELLVHATELKNKFTEKDNKIAKQRSCIHKLKAALKEHDETTEQVLLEKTDEIADLKAQRDELANKLNQIDSKYKSAKEDMNQLEVALMAEKTERENFENMMQENHSRMIGELDTNHNKQAQEHEVEKKQLLDEIENKKLKMNDLRSELERNKQQLRTMTQKYEQLKRQMTAEDEKYDQDKKQVQAEHEKEKEFMKTTFQNSLDELRKQCEKHREDVKLLSQKLNEEEIAKNELKQKLQAITKDKSKLKKQIKTLKDDNERQLKLTMIEARNKINASEAPMLKKIDEERSKSENAKKAIYAYINDNLGDYTGNDVVDDLSFRSGVQKVKTYLGKLTSSDDTVRKLVHAREGQETADAVAQMLI